MNAAKIQEWSSRHWHHWSAKLVSTQVRHNLFGVSRSGPRHRLLGLRAGLHEVHLAGLLGLLAEGVRAELRKAHRPSRARQGGRRAAHVDGADGFVRCA